MRLTVIGSSPAWPNPEALNRATSSRAREPCSSTAVPVSSDGLRGARAGKSTRSRSRTCTWITGATSVPWAWSLGLRLRPARAADPVASARREARGARFASLWGNGDVRARRSTSTSSSPDTPYESPASRSRPRRVPHFDLEAYGFRIRENGGPLRLLGRRGSARPPSSTPVARASELFVCEATLSTGESRTARPGATLRRRGARPRTARSPHAPADRVPSPEPGGIRSPTTGDHPKW